MESCNASPSASARAEGTAIETQNLKPGTPNPDEVSAQWNDFFSSFDGQSGAAADGQLDTSEFNDLMEASGIDNPAQQQMAFKGADTSGDGQVDIAEFHEFLNSFSGTQSSGPAQTSAAQTSATQTSATQPGQTGFAAETEQLFNRFDGDGNNGLGETEFHESLQFQNDQYAQANGTEADQLSRTRSDELYAEADTDGVNGVDSEEYTAFLLKQLGGQSSGPAEASTMMRSGAVDADSAEAWTLADNDGNGQVSTQEFATVANDAIQAAGINRGSITPEVNAEAIRMAFNNIDTSGNGVLSSSEFDQFTSLSAQS